MRSYILCMKNGRPYYLLRWHQQGLPWFGSNVLKGRGFSEARRPLRRKLPIVQDGIGSRARDQFLHASFVLWRFSKCRKVRMVEIERDYRSWSDFVKFSIWEGTLIKHKLHLRIEVSIGVGPPNNFPILLDIKLISVHWTHLCPSFHQIRCKYQAPWRLHGPELWCQWEILERGSARKGKQKHKTQLDAWNFEEAMGPKVWEGWTWSVNLVVECS